MEKFEGNYEIISQLFGNNDKVGSVPVGPGDFIKNDLGKTFYVAKIENNEIYGEFTKEREIDLTKEGLGKIKMVDISGN